MIKSIVELNSAERQRWAQNPFNIIDWLSTLNNYYSEPEKTNPSEISNVLCFALVWNEFEDTMTGAKKLALEGKTAKSLNLNKIENRVNALANKNLLKKDDFAPLLEKFKSRYVAGDKMLVNFEFYFLESEASAKRNLEEVMLGTKSDIKSVVFAMMSIAWRLRNNLFHGIKFVFELKEQNENFGTVNQLLALFSDILKSDES